MYNKLHTKRTVLLKYLKNFVFSVKQRSGILIAICYSLKDFVSDAHLKLAIGLGGSLTATIIDLDLILMSAKRLLVSRY